MTEATTTLTRADTQRWHAHHQTVGQGHLYQGRFKSCVVEQSEYFLTVCRYVERNPVRAGLVERAEEWRWGSAWQQGRGVGQVPLSDWPVERPLDWIAWVNTPQTDAELTAIRQSVTKGQPFGSPSWMDQMVTRWSLGPTLRLRGRPRKELVKMVPDTFFWLLRRGIHSQNSSVDAVTEKAARR